MQPIRVFVSYSHNNDLWIRRGPHSLIPWLANALRRDGIEFWYDPELKNLPGVRYREEIEKQIDSADLVVLLISQDFIISDFIRDVELPRIKKRFDNDQVAVIPILVGPVSWEGESEFRWLTDLQIIPGKPTPLLEYTSELAKWRQVQVEILDAIRSRIREIGKQPIKVTVDTRFQNNREESQTKPPKKRTAEVIKQWPEGKKKRSMSVFALAVFAAIIAIYLSSLWLGSKTLSISEPINGSVVGPECIVRGKAPRGVRDIWIVVNPVGSDEFWVQPKVEIVRGNTWEGRAYIGDSRSEGLKKAYRLRALCNAEEILLEGDVRGSWPAASKYSQIVQVTRRSQ
ncbi:MAG: toll/interleukin-1 receptor domain-containing protein [Acidobacteria bacterium]|nr:toll/interleukin-1 receptor domain-containing protein [Acidobacteriota bacterium]